MCLVLQDTVCARLAQIYKRLRCTCIRFSPAQGEQQCAVSTTCSISCQTSLSSGGVQTVLVPPQWYSTCSLACTHPCCLPPVWCNKIHTHTHRPLPTHTQKTRPYHSSNLVVDRWREQIHLWAHLAPGWGRLLRPALDAYLRLRNAWCWSLHNKCVRTGMISQPRLNFNVPVGGD